MCPCWEGSTWWVAFRWSSYDSPCARRASWTKRGARKKGSDRVKLIRISLSQTRTSRAHPDVSVRIIQNTERPATIRNTPFLTSPFLSWLADGTDNSVCAAHRTATGIRKKEAKEKLTRMTPQPTSSFVHDPRSLECNSFGILYPSRNVTVAEQRFNMPRIVLTLLAWVPVFSNKLHSTNTCDPCLPSHIYVWVWPCLHFWPKI